MGEILVSIVTVAYKSEKTIARSIESVLNQSYKNIEYIIVDRLSEDNTLSIAESYAESFCAAVLSLPMIYGKGSRENYPVLAKLAEFDMESFIMRAQTKRSDRGEQR